MHSTTECPSAEKLQQMLLGLGDLTEVETWEQHLESCPHCIELASQTTEDDLVRKVRQVGQQEPAPEPEVVANLISVLSQFGVAAAQTGTWSKSIGVTSSDDSKPESFLKKPHQPGEIGRVGPYTIHEVLGEGGMGVVYRGYDPQLRRTIAVKIIRPELVQSPGVQDRFIEEARAAAAIESDHIVTIYAVEIHDGVPCITMPLLQGEPLDKRLKSSNVPQPVAEIIRLGREIALGLAAAHARGLIHRDIKPGNLWLEKSTGRVKILDFGLALATKTEASMVRFGGTPGYMAPEQASGYAVDFRADLFSLGCVLYQVATGKLAFPIDTPIGMIVRTVTYTPLPVAQANPALPVQLANLIDRLLAKKPTDRPESATAVLNEFRAIEESFLIQKKKITRRRWLTGVATAAVGGGLLAWGLFAINRLAPTLPVEVELLSDTDVGALILSRDGVEQKWEPTQGKVALLPGDYQAKLAVPVAGRILMPSTFIVLPKEPKTIRLALVGEVAKSRAHSGAVTGVVTIGNQERFTVLSSSLDRTLGSWEPESATPPKFVNLKSPALCLAANGDGSLVAVAGGNKTDPFDLDIHLFNGQNLVEQEQSLEGHTRRVASVAMSSDGKQLISVAQTELWLWDVSARTKRVLEGHGERAKVTAVAFDPSRKQALTGDDEGYVVLWDVAEGKMLRKWIAYSVGAAGGVIALGFTANGFITTGDDGVIRLWDRESFKARELATVSKPIRCLAISKEATRLVTGSEDGSICLWSLPEGELIHHFAGHGKAVRSIAFTPDERSAVTGSEDQSVRLWRLPY